MQTPKPDFADGTRPPSKGDDAAASASNGKAATPDSQNQPTIISSRRHTTEPSLAASLSGKTLGHFELVEAIGAGGMATVIRANDLQLGRVVALKILPPEMAVDPENIARFKSEGRAAAKLDHENIARVFYCGEDQGLHFIAFEFVEGTDLRAQLAKEGRLSPAQAVRYMLQIATGLAHAAERGVIHRDIKPSNIIVTPAGRAKIVDMGLARHMDNAGAVTHSGVTLGTFDYISPEQAIEPRSADVRSDIYSLGCTFYHLLTGTPPVPEGTAAKKLHHHQQVAPVDPRELNAEIPDELAAILARMMAKEPRDRYQRPEHLIQHLIQVAQQLHVQEGSTAEAMLFVDTPLPKPPLMSPWLTGIIAAAAVAVLAAVFGFLSSSRDPKGLTLPWSEPRAEVAPPPWLSGNSNSKPPEPPGDDGNPPALPAEPRVAVTTQDLARLIDQKAEYIRLTSALYDLSDLHRENPQQAAGLRVSTRRLKLEGAAGARPPVIRWSAAQAAGREQEPVAAFHFAAADADAQADFVNVRFELHSTEEDPPVYAVIAKGLSHLGFRRCEFLHDRQADTPVGGGIRFEERSDRKSVLQLEECLYLRGPNAIELTDRSVLKASNCAFGPHDVVCRFRPAAVRTVSNPDWELADLRHCTVMIRSGAVFQMEKGASGTLRAGNSVFGRVLDPGDSTEASLIRQRDSKDAVAFAGIESQSEAPPRNVYHGLVIWDSPGRRAVRLPEARKQFGFADVGATDVGQRPWRLAQPLQVLDDNPLDAFSLNTSMSSLRTQSRSTRMLGVQKGVWGDTYTVALKPVADEPTENQAVRRIVNPTWSSDQPLPPLNYRSLEGAIGEAKPGDTILLQVNGPVELQPQRWSRADERSLVIRADDGFKPVLMLHSDAVESASAMFTIAGGRIEFRDLHFRMQSDAKKERERMTAVAISGAGQAAFSHCLMTLEEAEGCQHTVAQMVGELDAAGRTSDRRPRLRMENTFVRGKGNLLEVKPSRRFELELENSLIALDGTLVTLHAHPKESPTTAASLITCNRTTAFLSDYIFDFRLTEEDRKAGGGLATTHCKFDRSMLIAGNAKPLVHTVGIDSESLQKQYLTWEGRSNVYANYVQMIEVELPASTAMMPTMPVSPKAWRSFTREGEEAFVEVKLSRTPTQERPISRMSPEDFRVRPLDMKKMEAPNEVGAVLSDLPAIDEPAAESRQES
jgi:serine/threonine protein kinase